MDTIIESCLILMVLLLLTCARHLIVDCTALKSPIYLVTISSRGHKVVLCLPNRFTPPLPSVTFSELSSKCHSVCYKSCNSSLCLQVVAFCAETNLMEVCPLKKHFSGVKSWEGRVPDDLPYGCFLTFSSPPHLPVRRAASIRSSIRLTSIHQSTISDDTGLESSIWIT